MKFGNFVPAPLRQILPPLSTPCQSLVEGVTGSPAHSLAITNPFAVCFGSDMVDGGGAAWVHHSEAIDVLHHLLSRSVQRRKDIKKLFECLSG